MSKGCKDSENPLKPDQKETRISEYEVKVNEKNDEIHFTPTITCDTYVFHVV